MCPARSPSCSIKRHSKDNLNYHSKLVSVVLESSCPQIDSNFGTRNSSQFLAVKAVCYREFTNESTTWLNEKGKEVNWATLLLLLFLKNLSIYPGCRALKATKSIQNQHKGKSCRKKSKHPSP